MRAELTFALELVRNAGVILLSHFSRSHNVSQKGPDHPVTQADLEVDRFLRESIARQYPLDAWLSEETADDPGRIFRSRVWIVDPLDGTKEFVLRLPEFAVSLALIENGQPVIGVVYNPATEELYHAQRAHGVFLNGEPVHGIRANGREATRIMVSRTEWSRGFFQDLQDWGQFRVVGSIAYKLALLAAGQAEIVASLTPKHEWDVCAGALLVEEAGDRFTDLKGRGIIFNQTVPKIQGVLAAESQAHEAALREFSTRQICLRE